jgi:hypothetical protein
MQSLFAGTLFLSAALLFSIELMIPKMVLPLLGGSPAVWNTCMVFFQAALLGGYLYAHLLTKWLKPGGQFLVHAVLLGAPFLILPVTIASAGVFQLVGQPYESDPAFWLLRLLVVTVGLPFFMVASTATLLQKWFASTCDPAAGDPYFLYAASNFGSMVGLFGYLLLGEPFLRLSEQSGLWTAGYGLLVGLIAACALAAWRGRRVTEVLEQANDLAETPLADSSGKEAIQPAELVSGVATVPTAKNAAISPSYEKTNDVYPLTVGRRLRWVALAFVPSSLMLAITTYITTDVAAIPLLWVMPLAIYLLSFILVFARRQLVPVEWMQRALPFATLAVVFLFLVQFGLYRWYLVVLHWGVLFVAAMSCHGQLAKDRPPTRYLTEFYLWLSLGGVLGGMFTALAAPLLFQGGVLEYPLVLALACWLRPGPGLRNSPSLRRWLDLLTPLGMVALSLALVMALKQYMDPPRLDIISLVLGVLSAICVLCIERPTRFALTIAAMFLAVSVANIKGGHTILVERNFFGVIRVQDESTGTFRYLSHGSTMHGLQRLNKGQPDPECEPLSYFTRSGPIGQVFGVFQERSGSQSGLSSRVCITGLGVGALASYARPKEDWTFYEIDPAMQKVAEDPRYFSFLANCRTRYQIVLGDARLRLKESPEHGYGLMVLDAFSSDSVPTHLLTQEALALYQTKLAPGGMLAFNVSNRYLDLKSVLADLARAADPPLVCFTRDDIATEDEKEAGKASSQWLVMGQRAEDLGALAHDGRWKRLEGRPGTRIWTDDFSNILEVLRR